MSLPGKTLMFALTGAILGDVVTMLTAPAIIAWYNSTVDPSALCNCLSTARSTAHTLVQAQAIGAAVGAVICLIFGVLIVRARWKRAKAAQKPPTPAPS
jgi:hypothetical protein